jgi:Uma2 family endonuclease
MATIGRIMGPRPRSWTKLEYYRLAELGFFQGQRVELLEGKIVVLSPQNAAHWAAVDRVTEVLRRVFGAGYHVRMQGPLDIGQTSEPEPDICVVLGSRADYQQNHPNRAELVVEVSDARLSYDRRRKGSLYARAGIEDYWIVNLVNRQIEVYRMPITDPRRPYGHRYSSRTDLRPPATVAPLALSQAAISVTDLLG